MESGTVISAGLLVKRAPASPPIVMINTEIDWKMACEPASISTCRCIFLMVVTLQKRRNAASGQGQRGVLNA